uniref:Uncharacterized protein n=1 Tax=Arundo donax TaxID=35708 RepID=A0A0A8YKF4_ARUDO
MTCWLTMTVWVEETKISVPFGVAPSN